MLNVGDILNKTFSELHKHHLANALAKLQELYAEKPTLRSHDEYKAIFEDYERMVQFITQGFDDPERDHLYQSLLQRLYVLTSDLQLSWNCKNNSTYVKAFHTADHLNMGYDFLQMVLEKYVTDVAMLSLMPEENEEGKKTEIFERHQTFIERLFSAIFVSPQWSKGDEEFYEQLLLSPTIDSNDQRIIVAAMMLSGMNLFDFHKFRTLMNVYLKSNDEYVRQRALVGWVLMLHARNDLFTELNEIIKAACSDEAVVRDLRNLQMQFFYSAEAERDNNNIQREIMPDLQNSSHIKAGPFGISIQDASGQGDIFNPNADEEEMEKVEKRIHQMGDMFKKGSDIYFSGFRQMKSFPIFSSLVTWFSPFYLEHPRLSNLRKTLGDSKFKDIITKNSTFCESDKYSFACALEQVYSHIPAEVRKAVEEGGAEMGPLGGNVQEVTPSLIRRLFIQDLYRFFKLHFHGKDLFDPFEAMPGGYYSTDICFFVSPALLRLKIEPTKLKVAYQYYKRGLRDEAEILLNAVQEDSSDLFALRGHVLNNIDSIGNYKKALELNPNNLWALEGLAEVQSRYEHYEEAEHTYTLLCQQAPDNLRYALQYLEVLHKVGKEEKARELAYRLDFENPEVMEMKTALVTTLLYSRQVDKAIATVDGLLSKEITPELLILGVLSHLCSGNICKTVGIIRQAMQKDMLTYDQLSVSVFNNMAILDRNGVSPTTREIVLSVSSGEISKK